MEIVKRCVLIGLVLIAMRIPVAWIHAGFEPREVVLPPKGIDIPLKLETWTGDDQPVDSRLVTSLQADQLLNRTYVDDSDQIAVHVARWKDLDGGGTPHLPTICYAGNGWKAVSESSVVLNPTANREIRARFLTLEQSGEFVQVAYWYQLGPYAYSDNGGYSDVRRLFWQKGTWPPITKVLLHRHVSAADASNVKLREFATKVAAALSEPTAETKPAS